MHFEILVEDASGKIALEIIVPKILGLYGNPHTWKIISYKGIGRIPLKLNPKAYPGYNNKALESYQQDSICGTWEKLADVIHPGGASALKKKGYPESGKEKCKWAEKIPVHMNMENNQSPSFRAFRDCLLQLANNR